ncbi:sugar ABC transporter substrate-binding protein [Micromonospora sp. 4G55]|uniref:ABC transporter substrate-binding protein n=1 Tax=Micromonospora sp. 4G55 TaxID=2806102 RepID=UPI001A56BE2D|nr:sugar ABC transporter substrate-binding protein [Micromonospora sp. 4G55]MBM0257761.1 sugar ABC transporter substrate-binding protein [Micromonospora sp. 4G55]
MKPKRIAAVLALVALTVTLTACSKGEDSGSSSGGTVNWWTWDERQAASYQKCLPGFQQANPGITVKISQYGVEDYFTKLTAGFVSGAAPDAFQNSVPLLGAYAGQKQILALDDQIKKTGYDLSVFDIGVDSWKYTDGKQYGIPLDWAAAAIYFNKDKVAAAGLTDADITGMTWNPDDGGTFDDVVARLTVDKNGVRGDQPGFDKTKVATYGIGSLAAADFNGQTSWNPFVSTLGWRLGDKPAWPTRLPYDNPDFVKTLEYVRGLGERGLMPKFGQLTVAGSQQIGSGSVAMVQGGTWDATSITKIPGAKVGVAPTVKGPKGRSMISNSNANNIYAGTKNLDATWKWVTYMGSEACQSAAGADATFLPSIAKSLQVAVDAQKAQGLDLSGFVAALNNGELYPAPPTANGQELSDTIQPMFEAYFSGERDKDVFPEMATKTEKILAE